MSIEAVSWALNDAPDVPPTALVTLLGLANHAHPDGRAAWPSQGRLAHYGRKGIRAVQRDLAELERRGLIRRGNQRHVQHMPTDRRPVVWDLAVERRRETPAELSNLAEPQSGRPAELVEPVDNRGVVSVAPVDRGVVGDRPGRRLRPTGASPTTYEPSLTIKEPSPRARSLRGGVALPTDPRAGQCPKHRGSPAGNCGPCRAEALGGVA
ncbi:Helix-turn-helix domain-containing protein [Micromonospora sediminicola]|uniref:Helix-turn-helix domain-containing protein n=1 Tax=Micromonospora sediminicola TaxID=946078 RepID=A0A1A9BH69_9ACTN|nr:helix-turn-helix domain-containing protein [Micromonospora sediminicola]SBT68217.1 Helix-turn-helix domain-containing protein [Micromonospora sediminicola]